MDASRRHGGGVDSADVDNGRLSLYRQDWGLLALVGLFVLSGTRWDTVFRQELLQVHVLELEVVAIIRQCLVPQSGPKESGLRGCANLLQRLRFLLFLKPYTHTNTTCEALQCSVIIQWQVLRFMRRNFQFYRPKICKHASGMFQHLLRSSCAQRSRQIPGLKADQTSKFDCYNHSFCTRRI